MEEVGLKFIADGAGGFVAQVDAGSKAARVFGVETEGAGRKASGAFENIARGAQEFIGRTLVTQLMNAGQAVIGFVQSGVKGAADFQSSMALFETSVGATAEEMEQARIVAKNLGADLTLPSTSASDAGAAMTELGKAGLTAKEAMDATRGALQLAAAGNLGNAEAATIAAQALNAFGLEGGQATQVADMLAAAANASALEVRDVAEGFKMASSVFSSFQGPVVGNTEAMYDLTTALSIMANAGIVGSDAGTSLKQTLLQLSGPTDKAKNLMRELAGNLGITGDIAYDATGTMRPLRDIIDLTTRATANMTQEQKNYTITTIFGSDAMRSMITLMNAGAEGWEGMRSKVTQASSAADLAGVRMTGLNGAVAGLGSQVETLALEAFTPLLPVLEQSVTAVSGLVSSLIPLAGPMVVQVVTSITNLAITIGTITDVITTGFLPAMTAATVALGIYALVNLPAAIAALPILIGLLAGSVVGFAAQAAAAAAAAIPIIAIGVAIAGVAIAWNYYQDQVTATTQRVLESNDAWNQGTKVLQEYNGLAEEQKSQLRDQANHLQELRDKQTEQVAAYTAYVAMWGNTTSEAQRQRDAINELGLAITDETTKLSNNIETQKHLHDTDALEHMREMRGNFIETTTAVQLNKEEMEKWEKVVEEVAKKGGSAITDYVNTASTLMEGLGDKNKEVQDRITADQAIAYAEQSAAQKAHIGDLLREWTTAQIALGQISEERAPEIFEAINREFGQSKDVGSQTFQDLQGIIQDFANNSGGSLDSLVGDLQNTTDEAIELKSKADALQGQYAMEVVQNFKDGKIDAEELRRELEKIPARVYSEVYVTTYKKTVESSTSSEGGTGSQAFGGPVTKNSAYMVGEQGRELFVPNVSGQIVNSWDTQKLLQAMAEPRIVAPVVMQPTVVVVQPANTQNYYGQVGNTYSDNRTYSSNGAPRNLDYSQGRALYGSRG